MTVKDTVSTITMIILIVMVASLALNNFALAQEVEKFEMFYLDRNKEQFKGGEVTGLAYGDFFAVWSEGRTAQEVMQTCLHEYAHNEFGMVHPNEA